MKVVTHNKEIIEIIKKLSKNLLKSVLIKKDEEKVFIRMKAPSIYIDLNTPISNFDFDGEKIAFAEGVYDKFYGFMECFKNPTITQDANMFIIKEGKNSIKFRISDPELIEEKILFNGSKKKIPDPLVSISLDKDQFSNIKQMIKKISTEDVLFSVKKDKVIITIANENTKNSYDFEIDLDKEPTEEIEISIKSNIFDSAPELNYEVNITEVGIFHFKCVNENYELNLYTGMKSSI